MFAAMDVDKIDIVRLPVSRCICTCDALASVILRAETAIMHAIHVMNNIENLEVAELDSTSMKIFPADLQNAIRQIPIKISTAFLFELSVVYCKNGGHYLSGSW